MLKQKSAVFLTETLPLDLDENQKKKEVGRVFILFWLFDHIFGNVRLSNV